MLRLLLIFFSFLVITSCDPDRRQQMMISSPNVAIRALFAVNPDGTADYTVFWGSDTAIYTSPLGVKLTTGESLMANLKLIDYSCWHVNKKWTSPENPNRQMLDVHAELLISLQRQSDQKPLVVRAKTFNGCMAFRYEMPITDSIVIDTTLTGFRAYKQVDGDSSLYRSKKGQWIKRGKVASIPHNNFSYTDWELIYISKNIEGTELPAVIQNLERQ